MCSRDVSVLGDQDSAVGVHPRLSPQIAVCWYCDPGRLEEGSSFMHSSQHELNCRWLLVGVFQAKPWVFPTVLSFPPPTQHKVYRRGNPYMELAGLGITGDIGRKDGLECFSFLRSREGTEFLHIKLNYVELLITHCSWYRKRFP